MIRDGDLRSLFHDNLPEFDWAVIETGPTTPGVPDANAAGHGVEFWIEMKATKSYSVRFQQFQVAWIHRRVRAGGRVWIAVRRSHGGGPRRGPAVDELWLVSGRHVLGLEEEGLFQLAMYNVIAGSWAEGPSRWDWSAVRDILVGPF